MLAAAIATGVLAAQQGGGHITFVLSSLQAMPLSRGSQEWIFLFFAAAFLVKMPAFPLHGWMPDGYRAMPIEVLMVFSGVLSKVGAYGFLRDRAAAVPAGGRALPDADAADRLASIIYGSVVAFTQTDARLIVGYSSVAQMGFITLGIFALNPQGAQGALLQMFNHGLVVARDPVHRRPARPARRRLGGHPRDGRHRVPRAGARVAVPDRGAGDARDARLLELRRRVPDPAGRVQNQARDRGDRLQRRGDGERVRAAACSSARCTTASAPDVDSREISLLDSAVLVPLVAVILFLALYPQLALHRSERSVKVAVAPAQVAQLRPRTASPGRSQRRSGAAPQIVAGGAQDPGEVGTPAEAPRDPRPSRPPHLKGPHIDFAGPVAADRAARGRGGGAAGRPAGLALGARAARAGSQPCRAGDRARV